MIVSVSPFGPVTVAGSGSGTLSLTGTQAALNSFLGTATNIQYLHGTPLTAGDNADVIQVAVTDNGPGVSEKIRDRIFEPLVSGRSFGIGLGLPLVLGVLKEHGGSVEMTESADGGTVVSLKLPACAPA